ncbi:unnamed protein product [Fusarium langsethiae]|nr:unnamed protein product [Fusarium langsethiae]
MWLSRGLLASTLILAVKAQDGVEDAAMRIATGFAESLIQHAVKTLSGGAGDTGDTVNAGDQGNQGNQGQAFDATLIDAATVTHTVGGQAIVETYTRPGGQLFPVTLLPHPRITIAPTTDDPYERIIQAYTGGDDATTNQEITIAEPTGTKPGTVIVDVPGSAYSSFSSGQAGALTIPPSNDHPTATIISALPSGAGITGEATRTIPAAGGASATVVIQTPWEDVPPSTPGAGADLGGGAGGAGGNGAGSTSNILVIQTYTGTEYITQARVTTIAGSGGDQGTVVVQVPPGNQNPGGAVTIPPSGDSHFTTIVSQYTGDIPISTPVTRLVPTSGTQDGTIIIETPGPSSPTGSGNNQGGNLPENQPQVIPPSGDSPYSTILRPHAGSGEITEPVTYTIPPSGTSPGTVIIETPAVRAGQSVITLPSAPGSGYITIVRQPAGTGVITAATTITVPPSNGQPGTIIIETPAPQPGGGEITIPAGADGSFVTIIRGPTGTNAVNAPTTITVSGAPGQPGTVIIETPVGSGGQTTRAPDDPFTISAPGGQYVTIFRPHSGEPITVPITLTQPGQNGQPGTVIIETPIPTTPAPGSGPITIPAGESGSYVTVYRPHSGSSINQPITITIPPSGGQPGTIIVETPFTTPKGQNAVTSNEPGGQQITIPPSKNNPYVTIYRPHTGDPITVPITITQSPSNGQPGTIIIETPAPEPQTVTEVETAPGATVTVQPNNPGGYTTIYRPHTGDPISEPITVTTISGSNGQPGTVIIETQGPITITPTGSGGTATIYTPGTGGSTTVTKTVVLTASGGQSTTAVVIETPPPVKVQPTQSQVTGSDGFVTVTEQYSGTSVITAIFTTTVIASGTGPGTVFIETPPPVKFNPTSDAPESTVTGNDNYVTVFKPFPGPGIITAPITVTEATPSGGQPGTVVIQTPVSENPTTSLPQPSTTQGTDGYVTVYLPFPGPGVITQPYTRTQAPSGGNPGTVFITTPAPQPATTTPLPAPSTTNGPDGYVTVFLPFPGPGIITQSYTRTQAPSGGNPGTVFITTPAPLPQTTAQQNLPSTTSGVDGYVTVFIPYPGPGQITAPITSTQPPANGQPGTVFITTPVPAFSTPKQANGLTSTDGYVTVFVPYPGPGAITAPITSTQAPANGQPGTVFITTPALMFSTPKQANGLTSTSTGTDGYVTVFVPYPGPGAITAPITSTQPPANGQPGTVYITTPAPAFSTPKQANGLTSTTTGTDGYITVFVPYPGPGSITAAITSTQPPANGQPGTVYITTPAPISTPEQKAPSTSAVDDGYMTVFLPFPGPGTITAPITSTQPPSGGNPGTVFITTPVPSTSQQGVPNTAQGDGGYVTVFLPYTGAGVITAPITSTQAPSGGNPGTVFITTPGSGTAIQSQTPALTTDNYITIQTPFPGPGVITSPITITKPPANGQPGTVLIQTPAPASSNADSYVTVYRPYPGPGTITAPITLTQAPANGQPGTVFIETQPTYSPTSSPTSGDSASPITIPPAPTGSYVTIFRPYPGPGQISSAVTYTQAPVSGQPGTVIIETPNSDAPTATQTGPVTVPTGSNNPYVTVFRTYPGPGNIDQPLTITSVTASGDQPGTIVIETPTPEVNTKFAPSPTTSSPVTIPAGDNNYVTVYRPHTGSPITAPVTVTTIAPTGGQPGTVIIETPGPESQPSSTDSPPVTIPQGQDGYVTVYQPYPGPGTITEPVTVSSIAPSNGQPGTVVIQTPAPAVSTSSTSEQTTSASAVTIPADNGGYVTVYRPFPGPGTITAPRTVGTVAPTSGRPGTVIIETPAPQATENESSSAQAISSTQGNDGYVTVFQPHTGTGVIGEPITVSTIPPSNGQPGTVIVETPVVKNAESTTQTGDNAPVTIPPSPENTYLTVYRPHTGANLITAPVTVTTIQGENGQPGTIIIETPAAQAAPSTDDSRGAPVTIPPGPENSYVTVYRPHTGTDSITAPVTVTTIQGVNGQPGTIIIETPEPMAQTPISTGDGTRATLTVPPGPGGSYATVYRPYTGTEAITAPITSTIEGTNGQPGTVIIETPTARDSNTASTVLPGPGSSYTTVYRPYIGTESITTPITSTIEGTNGQPGTVIIETPAPLTVDNNAPTTVPPGPGSLYVTVYRPYTGTESITAPITSTIQGTNGQPGTIVIETATSAGSDANAPSTAPAGPHNTYITVYQPYPGSGRIDQPITVTIVEPSNGNPGTVIIQTPGLETGGKQGVPPVTVNPAPGEQYTTIYRPHTGTGVITAPVTITTIAPAGGQPGTVIIENPEPETPGPNPTVTLTPGPNESYVTVFQPHTGTDVITGPVVITTIAPDNGQPGTVIIETPVAPESTSTPLPAESATGAPEATATYVTVYRPHIGPERITAPVTISTINPSGGQPGTVIIETPDQDLPPVTTSAGPAASYVTVYQPHTGTERITAPVTITTLEPANGQPGTVIVETPGQQAPPMTSTPSPASYVTISRPYTGTEPITEPIITTISPQGDQPGTVIFETPGQKAFQTSATSPPSYVTVSRPYTGTDQITAPIITTVSPQGDQPGTVIYETQAPFATVYRPYTGTEQITGPVTVSTIAPNGDQPGTIIVETPGAGPAVTTTPPAPSYMTITNPYTGTERLTEPTTLTTVPPQGDQPGTVIVETQRPYMTISTLYTGVGTITGPVPLTTIPPQGDQPGTVVMGTLGSYVTITTPYTGDQPGTVIVETPQSYVTTTVPYTGIDQITAPTTATTIPPSRDRPGTVVVQTQAPFATIYRPHTGPDRITAPVTVSTIAPNGDQPGTIIVETPGSEPPVTTTPPAPSYTTVYEEYTGTGDMTEPSARTTIEPQGDQPGTIIFDTPGVRVVPTSAAQASYATVYRPHTGTDRITEPVTITTVAPQGGQPGTVIIETPGSEPAITSTPAPQPSYITVYQPHTGPDGITELVTVTTIAPQGDQPGTVIIETPGSEPARTTGPAAQPSYVTVYQSHTGPNRIKEPATITTIVPQDDKPGTVIIETPGSEPPVTSGPAAEPSYVTIYQPHTGADQITAPVTVKTIEPQGNQPGTVIIETPGSAPPLTTGTPPPAPEPSYVTVYRPHTGTDQITAPVTITTIEPQGDQPGTVIIETPGSEPPVTSGPAAEPSYTTVFRPHTGIDTITAPVTITTIQPQGDQPGTVIIETPGSELPVTSGPAAEPSYITVFRPHTGINTITAPITITTIKPQGDKPGTVIIETPGPGEPITSAPGRYTTIYEPHTGTGEFTGEVTRTITAPEGDRPGIVVIETAGLGPNSGSGLYTTIYEPHTGTGEFTGEVTRTIAIPQGDRPGTVVVETPGLGPKSSSGIYTTIYEAHAGTGEFTGKATRTIATPQGDRPGTVVIETSGSGPTAAPGLYTTIYEPHTGIDEFTDEVTRTIAPPEGDRPGTVVVETSSRPGPDSGRYTTIYKPHAGTGEFTGEVTRTVASPQGDQPGTVVIETPRSGTSELATYTTIYEPHTGSGEFTGEVTRTVATPYDGQPGTIVIETSAGPSPAPGLYTTVYEPHTGTGEFTGEVTRTIASAHDGQPGTVVVETPGPQTANKGVNPPMTIPAGDDNYVTVFIPYTGTPQITAPSTVTTIAPSNGQPGTVIIETPVPETTASGDMGNPPVTLPAGDDKYATIFRPHTGTDVITAPVTVTTITPSGGQPGTVIIETPEPITEAATTMSGTQDVFVTIYRPYTGTEQITAPVTVTTIAPVSGTGTVVIETLAPQTASTVYVTIYRPYTGTARITEPTTVTTIAPVSGTGTVVVETPTPEPTVNSQPATASAITIPSNDENRNVTVIRPYPGPGSVTAPVTRYVPPTAAGEPGTVIIETPVEQSSTEAQPQSQPTSAPAVTIPPSDGSPNITVVREYPGPGVITAPVTSYEPPRTPGQPGTVIIETPAPAPSTMPDPVETMSGPVDTVSSGSTGTNVTFYTLAPPGAKTPITSYAPPQTPGQTGTVFIQTVASESGMSVGNERNVTIMTDGSASLTAPYTRYQSPGTPGDPGTVIIETPPVRSPETTSDSAVTIPAHSGSPNVTVIRGGPGKEASTIYIPPTGTEPGTIIIETPTDVATTPEEKTSGDQTTSDAPAVTLPPSSNSPNVTVIRPYPGPGSITEPVTRYVPPTASGEPGTVIIETQSSASSAPTSANPEITLPPSSQSPNVTVIRPYPGPGSIIEPVTRYVPPTASGEPGTVIIETQTTDTSTELSKTSPDTLETSSPSGITIPPHSGSPNATVFRPYTGPGTIETPITSYIPPANPGEPGTVVIETPVSHSDSSSQSEAGSTSGPASNAAVLTSGGNTTPFSSPSSNPEALTITPSDSREDVTVVEPNTKFAGATENVTQIVPPSGTAPGTKIIYTPVNTPGQSSVNVADTDSYVTISATVTIPGDPSTRTGVNSNARSDAGTTGAETNVIIIPPSGTEPGTVLSQTSVYLDQTLAQHGNVTITRAALAGITTPFTTYSPPAQSGDKGTVVVEIPDYNVTTTRAGPSGVTTTLTSYSPPVSPGEPGMVIIETPDYNVTVTRQAPASVTSVRTTYAPPGTLGDPGTIIVETPNNDYNVTITRGASITAPFTTYSPPGSSGDPGTVVVETPDYNVTVTTQGPSSITSVRTKYVSPASAGDPGTVVVETPNNDYNVTVTRAAPASVTKVYTKYAPPGAPGDPGTVFVETPDYNVTVTRGASVTAPYTTYSPPATPGDPGTVIVATPDYNVTVTTEAPKTVTTLRSTYVPPGKYGDPGTVIIETPIGPYNVTTTRGASITAPFTTYSPPGSPGDPGTVIVETPDYNVTITRQGPKTATAVFSTYSPPGNPGDPGTVIVETPAAAYNVTTTQGASTITTPFTTYLRPGEPGTVLVETPDYNVTITREGPKSVTSLVSIYSPPGSPGDPGTVIIETPMGPYNITTTRGASSVTAPFTTYVPPGQPGDPGTVLVETPEYNVTITSQATDSVSDTVTRYNPPASPGDPGTVAIIMPNQKAASTSPNPSITDAPGQNVTVYRPGPRTLTGPVTSYIPPASPGENGTVIIETPGPATSFNITTTQTVSTITAIYTTYLPAGAQDDPGTILVGVPPSRNVTITKDDATITAPYTTYSPPGNAGDPGTVIIGMPADRNVSITSIVNTRTAPYTTYMSPGNRGDPGTVVVELPPDSNVTTTKTVSDRTAVYTTYSAPVNRGDPGTVIIEVPPGHNVTVTQVDSTITSPYTSYSSPAKQGDPGTVFIGLPAASNVTITTEVATRTSPYTTYSPPAQQGDLGTVIVELPPDRNTTITTEVASRTKPFTTYMSPASKGDPGTVIVEMPPDRNVTITTEAASITAPYTSYVSPGTQGDPGTVVIGMPPDRNVTITTEVPARTAPYTTYSAPGARGDPGTVIIELPSDRNVTITTEVAGRTAPYTTFASPATKGYPGTVIVELPPGRNVTTTEQVPTLTQAYTTYSPPGSQGDPGTVIVRLPPDRNVTTTTVIDTLTAASTVYSAPANRGDPGTIIIEIPPARNVTTTEVVNSITRATTTYAPPANQGDPGTVIVQEPPETNTTIVEVVSTITRPATRFVTPGTKGDPGTVYIDVPPNHNVTITTTVSTITRPSTTFAPGATEGDAGTVLVEMPPEYNITTTQTVQTISRPVTRYSSPAETGDPGTVYLDLPPEYNVTVTTTIYSITRQSTTFAAGATQGDPGTVIIEMRPEYNVTTTQTVQTISRPVTRYSKPGEVGDPGTIYIDLPPEYNVTVTTTVPTITRQSTTFAPAAQRGDPGTIIIEIPPDTNTTTTQTIQTITRPVTRYSKPGEVGDPGTVYVDLPPEYNVTKTTTVPTMTRASTTFVPASVQGDAGTVLVQVPPDTNVTTTQTVSTISRPVTRYSTPDTVGDPGTVYIDLPPEYNVTRTATVATITRASTTFAPADMQGDPGTVIVQLPPDYNVTRTETVSTISRARTTYNPAGTQGDPNTVLVQVPVDYNVTTTETVSTITRVRTTYNPGVTQGDPGTVLVEVPVDYNVTTTETVSTISSARTTYNPGATQGDPGTVLVQVPPNDPAVPTSFQAPGGKLASSLGISDSSAPLSGPSASLPTGSLSVPSAGLPSGSSANLPTGSLPTDSQLSAPSVGLPSGPSASLPTGSLSAPSADLPSGPSANLPTGSLPTGSQLSAPSDGLSSASLVSSGGLETAFEPPGGKLASSLGVSGLLASTTDIPPASGMLSDSPISVPSANLPSAGLSSALSVSAPTPDLSSASVASVPSVGVPSAGVPSVGVPSASVTSVPAVGVPSVGVSSASLPSASLPSASVATASVTSLPAVGVPSVGIPSASLPSANLPSISSTTVPSVPVVSAPSAIVSTAPTLSTSSTVQASVVASSTSSKYPQASFGPTFDCDGYGYVISTLLGNTLTKVNLIDGTRTTVATGIGPGGSLLNVAGVAGAINGIGFNKLDGYIYGVVNQGLVSGVLCGLLGCAQSQLIRIAKNGGYETLKLTIPSNMVDMGDVDEQGRFWVSENGKKWWCIDVNPASSTFGKLLNSGTSATDIISGVGDWAYVPGGGDYLYAIQASVIESGLLRTNIVRWSRTTFTWSRYQSYPNLVLTSLNLVWGAVMAGPDGTLYGQENLLGQTWKFTLGNTANPTAIPGGSIANLQGDGARCIDAKTVFPPFTCDGKAYVVSTLIGNTLTSVNINDGSRATVANNIGPGGAIDAIGYNKLDNYIYGVVDQGLVTGVVTTVLGGAQSQVIRIASDGQYQTLSVTVPSNTITMGDVDDQGRLWLSESGKRWWCIDVNPSSPTANKMIANGTSATDVISGIGDWAFVPGGGDYLYAVQASIIESGLMRTNIVRWSRTTRTWERYQSYPNLVLTSLNLVWGAVWAGPGGTLYAQENLLGQTWKFTLGSSTNPVAIPGGSIANLQGDGARCIGQDPATTIQQQTTTSQQLPSVTVTSTITVPQLTHVVTSLALPGVLGGPATLLVQVPPKSTVTTTQTVSTITRATTVSMTAADLGSPDTVIVRFPIPYNVTITTAGPTTLTATSTMYSPPGTPGDPGTVIVQRPPVTVSTIGSSAYTTYNPPGASGDPGTVVIATTTIPAAPSYTSAGPQFSCDVYGYLMQKTALYRVEITSGKTTLINANVGGGGWINGIGYNRFDNYIYGMYQDSTGTQLIRIGGDGTSTLLAARTSDRNVNMGDIDNQGHLWISNNGGAW